MKMHINYENDAVVTVELSNQLPKQIELWDELGVCLLRVPVGRGEAFIFRGELEERGKPQHWKPHFNDRGGCVCKCPLCLSVRMKEHNGHIDINQKCVCRECNEECPSDRALFAEIHKQ